MAGELNGSQSCVRQKYSDALCVHCCAHRLNPVLCQAICNSKQCKIFLRHQMVSLNFSRSPKRSYALDEEVKRRPPKVAPTRWNSNSRIVQTVHEC
jgi:hypothetical protein